MIIDFPYYNISLYGDGRCEFEGYYMMVITPYYHSESKVIYVRAKNMNAIKNIISDKIVDNLYKGAHKKFVIE